MTTTTYLPKTTDIKREWVEIDASQFRLGRLATVAARLLIGKHRANYTPHMNLGDFVVITNAEKVKTTGRKLLQKTYFHHSGYLGGLSGRKMGDVLAKHPEKILYSAVRGMLPTNRLRRERLGRLKLVVGSEHKFKIDKKITK